MFSLVYCGLLPFLLLRFYSPVSPPDVAGDVNSSIGFGFSSTGMCRVDTRPTRDSNNVFVGLLWSFTVPSS